MCIEERLEHLENMNIQLIERIKELENKEKPEEYVTPQQLAEKMGCSANNVYIKIRSGEIKAIHIGRNPKIPMSQFCITEHEEVVIPKKKRKFKENEPKSIKEAVFG